MNRRKFLALGAAAVVAPAIDPLALLPIPAPAISMQPELFTTTFSEVLEKAYLSRIAAIQDVPKQWLAK